MKWAYICQHTVKIGSFFIQILSLQVATGRLRELLSWYGSCNKVTAALPALKITVGFSKYYLRPLAFQSFRTTWIARSASSALTDFMLRPEKHGMEVRCLSFHHIHWPVHTASTQSYFSWAGPLFAPAAQTQSIPFSSFHKGDVSEEPTKQNILSHMLRRRKSQRKKNYGSPAAFCCWVAITLFKFMTFTLFHNEHTI